MTEVNRRDLLAGAAAFAGFATVGLLPGTAAAATRQRPGALLPPSLTTGDKAVVARIDVRRALKHLKVLSDGIGWRIAGTESEHRAARYIAGVLRDLGYKVELQPFPVADKNLAEIRAKGERLWQASASLQGATDAVRGTVLDVGKVVEVPADADGKLVVFDRITGKETDQAKAAAAAGAKAALIINARSDTFPERKPASFAPALAEPVAIPVLGLAGYHGERIRAGAKRLSIEITGHTGMTSYNVLAERKATLPNPDGKAVIVSAHYDSVPGSPGANDDASGTVLCLELARVLRRLPTQQAIRIYLWGAEENGLIGSRYYVKGLDETGVKQITGCFQNDMVATSHPPAETYWLLSVDGKDNTTTAAVNAAARRLGYVDQVQGPTARGSSDHEAFYERGIAAGNFSWRGNEAPSQLEPIYHTPEDTIAQNISLKRLKVSMEIIGCAAYEVARHK
ncbi:M20/M25/M40 family metallo-hydrolase [Actinomadura sp. KC216]|uniref:M20/M25/M40 family metallo-hydrolase n=1 Tax=Actinomadura sp. KC216 TaxID=2530370 RepID=UPI00104640C8|nr:M20/M25/M40 family metallo-hydrolase [Actinomadura sp. KC216]TDB71858.1 M20/M25/M40 family metallo-hydrolase [Actinomadura sp. KC216]